jgi:hypothetical protein
MGSHVKAAPAIRNARNKWKQDFRQTLYYVAVIRVAFVAAARLLGGQLFVSFINEVDLLPKIYALSEQV